GFGLWKRGFGGDPQIIGSKLILNMFNTNEATVIGVMPADFGWHVKAGSNTRKAAEMWAPWQVGEQTRLRQGRFAMAVARLKPGVTHEQAQAEMNAIGGRVGRQDKEINAQLGGKRVSLRKQVTREGRVAVLGCRAA